MENVERIFQDVDPDPEDDDRSRNNVQEPEADDQDPGTLGPGLGTGIQTNYPDP